MLMAAGALKMSLRRAQTNSLWFSVEHVLRIISAYTHVKISTPADGDLEAEFFIEEYPYVFPHIPYNRTLGVMLKVK